MMPQVAGTDPTERSLRHDLNNLLSVVISYADFAARDLGDHPAAAAVEKIRLAAHEAADLLHSERVPEQLAQTASTPSDGRRVLLVDDDPDVREVAMLILEGHGYEVVHVSTPESALALRLDHVAVLVTDVVLPQMSGFDLARRVREQRDELRVVFMSGHDESPEQLPWGSVYLRKPFTRDRLLAAVAAAEGR
jgi:CheY-like chemotaxis protein